MECRGYGPCEVAGVPPAQRSVDRRYDAAKCEAARPAEVLRRVCGRMAIDEELYGRARRAFEAKAAASPRLAARVELLREAGRALAARADAQERAPPRKLAQQAGVTLRREYVTTSGGRVPWRVDETAGYYRPHERARFSCEGCAGDVVPEFDLIGCWPLWTQFAPDEMRYRCKRSWTTDPGLDQPDAYRKKGAPMPCWQNCWHPMDGGAPFCNQPCPNVSVPAVEWRRSWDAGLAKQPVTACNRL